MLDELQLFWDFFFAPLRSFDIGTDFYMYLVAFLSIFAVIQVVRKIWLTSFSLF